MHPEQMSDAQNSGEISDNESRLTRLLIEGLLPNERKIVYRQYAISKLKQHLNTTVPCSIISEEENAQGIFFVIQIGEEIWAVGISRQTNFTQAIEKNPSLLHNPDLYFFDIKTPVEVMRLGTINDFNPALN